MDESTEKIDKKEQSLKQIRNFYKKLGYSKIDCFFSSLDDKLTGNKVYDWYWWHIWSNIKKPYDFLERKKNQAKYRRQRAKNSLSEQDAWGLGNHILEVLYNGLTKYYMKGEFGKDWRDDSYAKKCDKEKSWCNTHNKKFYNDSIKYIKLYEKYVNLLEDEKSTLDEVYEMENELYSFYSEYVSKYLRILWW